jgi:hypothetical protein
MRVIKCHCGEVAEIHGSDYCDDERPWYVSCTRCCEESLVWAYRREAVANFRAICRAKLAVEKPSIAQQAASQNASTRIGSAA